MVVTYVGVELGQLLLNVASPEGHPLFIPTSVLISIAVVPYDRRIVLTMVTLLTALAAFACILLSNASTPLLFIGAVIGPVLIASVMDQFGDSSFFWCMGVAYLLTGIFALYRMTKRSATPLEQQGSFTPAAIHPSSSAIESIQQYAKDEELKKTPQS
jgi:hypothetical protein